MLKGKFTWNPKWGQNVIIKVKLIIFVPVLPFKRRFKFCFVMFLVNKYVLYFFHLTFCDDKVKILRKNTHTVRHKTVAVNRRFFKKVRNCSSPVPYPAF